LEKALFFRENHVVADNVDVVAIASPPVVVDAAFLGDGGAFPDDDVDVFAGFAVADAIVVVVIVFANDFVDPDVVAANRACDAAAYAFVAATKHILISSYNILLYDM